MARPARIVLLGLTSLMSLAWLGDAPPPAPAPGGEYKAADAEGVASFANPNLGNACKLTERIVVSSFVVRLPPVKAGATNLPPPPKKPAPAFVVAVPDARMAASYVDTGDPKLCGAQAPKARPLNLRYLHRGTYSTADGKIALRFADTGVPATAGVTFTGVFNAFTQSGTATIARADVADPTVTYKIDVPLVFTGPPKQVVHKPAKPTPTKKPSVKHRYYGS